MFSYHMHRVYVQFYILHKGVVYTSPYMGILANVAIQRLTPLLLPSLPSPPPDSRSRGSPPSIRPYGPPNLSVSRSTALSRFVP